MMGPVVILAAPPPDLSGLPLWALAVYAVIVGGLLVAALVLLVVVLWAGFRS